jgi:hypothetical protein
MQKLTLLLVFTLLLNSCGLLGDKIGPAAAIEATKTSAGAAIGSVFTIPAAGGTASVPSATAKVTVPAGTMTTALSIQANADMLDGEGQGIGLTGDWTKPITVEFAIPAGVTDPENYKIALRLSNGYWVTCRKAKINTANNTVSVRIAPSIKTKSARKARPMANTYSLVFAKTFFLKPDRATVKLGEKVKFTAYAREGFIPKELMGKVYDSEVEFEAGLKKLSEAVEEVESNEDDLVPLPNLNAKDDDELVPLTIIAKEVPFSNKKEGFTRTWTAKSIGSISASGNLGAEYTAPKDETAKGKTVKVQFSSINDKTKRKADAEATVLIDDGIEKYIGTIQVSQDEDNDKGNKGNKSAKYDVILTLYPGSKVIFDTYIRNGNAIVGSNIKMMFLNDNFEYVIPDRRKGTYEYSGRTMLPFTSSFFQSKPIFQLSFDEVKKTFSILTEVGLEGGSYTQTCTPISTTGNPCIGYNGTVVPPISKFSFNAGGFKYTDKNKLTGTYSTISKTSGGEPITFTTKLDMVLDKVN